MLSDEQINIMFENITLDMADAIRKKRADAAKAAEKADSKQEQPPLPQSPVLDRKWRDELLEKLNKMPLKPFQYRMRGGR